MDTKVDAFKELQYNTYKEYIDNDDYRGLLYDMLAVAHGDGGHYTLQHGELKSFIDALNKISELVVK